MNFDTFFKIKKNASHYNIQLATMYNIWGPIHKIIHNIHLYTTIVTITNGLFKRQIIIFDCYSLRII